MNVRGYSAGIQMAPQAVTMLAPKYEQMSDIVGPEIARAFDSRMPDLVHITAGDAAPFIVPLVEMRQFRRQQRRLQLVEPAVASSGPAHLIFFAPPILTQFANPLRDPGIARRDRAAVSKRAEILGRVKAEAARIAKTARGPALAACAMRLSAIFEESNVMQPANLGDGLDLDEVSVE